MPVDVTFCSPARSTAPLGAAILPVMDQSIPWAEFMIVTAMSFCSHSMSVMDKHVSIIRLMSVIPKITHVVVGWVAVIMADLHPIGARANKSSHHQTVNFLLHAFPMGAQIDYLPSQLICRRVQYFPSVNPLMSSPSTVVNHPVIASHTAKVRDLV